MRGARIIKIKKRRFSLPAKYKELLKIDDNWVICLERYWHPTYLQRKDFLEMIRVLPETELDAHLSQLEAMLGNIETFKQEVYANSRYLKKLSKKITIPQEIYSKTGWPETMQIKIWYIPFRKSIMLANPNEFEEAAKFVLKDIIKDKNEYCALFENYFHVCRQYKIEDLQRIVTESCATYWQKEFFEKEKIIEFLTNAKEKAKIVGYETLHPILEINNELYVLISNKPKPQSDCTSLEEYLAIKIKD